MNRKILYPLLLFLFVILLKDLNAETKPLKGVCTKVFDGDTIKVRIEGTKILYRKVRLIGVDTPEMDYPDKKGPRLAREAKSFVEKMVLRKKVILEFDWEKEDKYGRLLAYVFLQDGRMLNAEIIKQGYGFAYTRFPFRYMDEFRRYEREAREKGLGLWKGGGKAELRWLINEKRIPFKVYEMANNQWAIGYQRYIKTRLNDEELIAVLSKLRIWVHELNERDLRTTLLKEGWEEMD